MAPKTPAPRARWAPRSLRVSMRTPVCVGVALKTKAISHGTSPNLKNGRCSCCSQPGSSNPCAKVAQLVMSAYLVRARGREVRLV